MILKIPFNNKLEMEFLQLLIMWIVIMSLKKSYLEMETYLKTNNNKKKKILKNIKTLEVKEKLSKKNWWNAKLQILWV